MKGQIFIILSIFVLLFLFLMRINTQTIDVKPDDLFYEDFSNFKSELIETIDMSILNQENLQSNLNNFIDFSDSIHRNKGYTQDIEYSISTTGDSTVVYLNITLESDNSYLMENLIINRTLSVFA
jgi:hypothetical protein